MTTLEPAAAAARAIASPSPLDPPVTSATFWCQNDIRPDHAAGIASAQLTDLTSAGHNVGLRWLFRKRRWLFTSSRAPPPGVLGERYVRFALQPGARFVTSLSTFARTARGPPVNGGPPRAPPLFLAPRGGARLFLLLLAICI